ncbi:N-acetyl-alpha-D-glucosaminyl-diphospho-ditrans octacis-undecaprenol 4-epimerase [termite gut metagenome]|uniref:N-acetyl-alpha-D-glucosaminyl-diphospho-ditrans octacis-undecaprenol 4-epimerase n=1 Tax=termite gut metagenome TaxID=433724 RepID=A0A5J4Q3F7_9ZZZZ
MKISILGASGFLGTRLLALLKQTPAFQLQNLDKQPSKFHPEITTTVNILDKERLCPLLKDTNVVVLLAAEHRDDVTPVSLYYEVNVGGMRNTLEAMEANGVKRIVFTSSVAVYGLNKDNPNEKHLADPFNHYGKSKWQAEQILQEWYQTHPDWNINIIRPTVIFGERNRGNVYNLLKQIASGKFLMVGDGNNKKSMAYVGNVAVFIQYLIEKQTTGYNVYNYVDKPDFTTNELVAHVSKVLNKHIPTIHFPLWLGMLGGYCFDALSFLTQKKLTISSVRVKKFCATKQFDATKITSTIELDITFVKDFFKSQASCKKYPKSLILLCSNVSFS